MLEDVPIIRTHYMMYRQMDEDLLRKTMWVEQNECK